MVTSYIDKACRHFNPRIEEHIKKYNKSHNFKHLHSTATCFDSNNIFIFYFFLFTWLCKVFVEYQDFLTGGSPGVSLVDKEILGIFNLNYNAGP